MNPRRLLVALAIVLGVTFPYLPFVSFSLLGSVNQAAEFALIAVSVVVLTGWVGQISLGHAGLVGTGAYVTGLAMGGLSIGFPVSLIWGAASGMLIAVALGAVALRVRGLYLAVATLIFSWVAQEFLFQWPTFTKHSSVEVGAIGKPDTIPYFDWGSREVYYYAAWATVLLAIFLASNIRDSKTGRAFFAVRGSEVAAASLGIDVMRTKLVAFAVSGALAGAAGTLIMVRSRTVTVDLFKVDDSLFMLAIAVVGGLSSLGGAVAAALVFALLELAYFTYASLGGYQNIVSAALLAVVLLGYRGGLGQIPADLAPRIQPLIRRAEPLLIRLDEMLERGMQHVTSASRGLFRAEVADSSGTVIQHESRLLAGLASISGGRIKPRPRIVRTEAPLDLDRPRFAGDDLASPQPVDNNGHNAVETALIPDLDALRASGSIPAPQLSADRSERRLLLRAAGVTVRFGGVTANENVNLEVREGEIVGLIGPNGAGKTTCFNAIAGLNEPDEGSIELFGQDVTALPVHQRALLGVGRTFQAIQLFGQLTVFENLLVATHQHNATGLLSHMAVTPQALSAEAESRRQVERVISMLDLDDVADRVARDLPFGVLRMVEVARALVTGSRLIMLDEPASGLDNLETDKLSDLIRFIRSLGVTVLLIEHDVRMVTALCDYLYVLNQGTLLADGPAAAVVRDPGVVAAYLGRSADPDEQPAEVSA